MAAAIMMLTASAVPVHQDMGANLVKQVSVLEVISWGDWHCGKKVACTVEYMYMCSTSMGMCP